MVPGVLMLVGYALTLLFDLPLASDPVVYLERLRAIEAGGVPYVDPVFEHLPGMLVPMYLARLLAWGGGVAGYVLAFGLIMVACLFVSGVLLVRRADHPRATAVRWLLLIGPLVPVVAFRNDPWVVMWGLLALAPGALPPAARGVASVVGVLSKGWPVVCSVLFWREGRRWLAGLTLAAGVVAAAIMATDGFQGIQQGAGLHSESLGGSLTGLWRSITGDDLGLVLTTAAYIEVPDALRLLGPALAALVASLGVVAVWRADSDRLRVVGTGILVVGVILASRLFSAQYVLWLAPFLALSRRRTVLVLGVLAGAQALHTLLAFSALFDGDLLWWAGAVARNVVLLVLAALLARECLVGEAPEGGRPRTA